MPYQIDTPKERCPSVSTTGVHCVLTDGHKATHVTPNGNRFLRGGGPLLLNDYIGADGTGQYLAGLRNRPLTYDAMVRQFGPLMGPHVMPAVQGSWSNPFVTQCPAEQPRPSTGFPVIQCAKADGHAGSHTRDGHVWSARPAPSADSETNTFRIQLVDAAGNVKQSHYSVADLLARLAERCHNDAAVTLEQAVRAVEASVGLEQKARERLSTELVWTRQHMTSRMDRLEESSLGQRRGSDAFQRDLITRQQLTDALASRTQADDRTWDVRRQAVVEAMAKRDNVLKEATLVNLQALEKRLADRLDRLDRLLEQTTASDATGPWDATSPEPPRESQYRDAGNFTWTFVDGRWGYQVAGGQWIAVGPWPHLTTGSESSGPLVVADFPWVRV